MKPLLEVKNLCIDYRLQKRTFKAVKDVSFSLMPGEIMGLAGESGSGKTTVGLSILKLLHENGHISAGEIIFNGQNVEKMTAKEIRQLRWKEISMVFQGAMNAFNPVRKMGEQLIDVLTLRLKMSKKEATKKAAHLLNVLGIDESRMNQYPHEFSGGMRQRAMVAMALVCNPKLVIADEPTTALDVMVKSQMLQLLRDLREQFEVAMIVVSHDLSALAEICDKVAVMNEGEIVEIGTAHEIFFDPKHPYTKHLIEMIPRIEGVDQLSLPQLVESELTAVNENSCVFVSKCPYRLQKCFSEKPIAKFEEQKRLVKCHLG